jgi:hypothetical protein
MNRRLGWLVLFLMVLSVIAVAPISPAVHASVGSDCSGSYGTGADGSITFSTSQTLSGPKDYVNMTVNGGVVLTITTGSTIYVCGVLANSGTIAAATIGTPGSGAAGGAAKSCPYGEGGLNGANGAAGVAGSGGAGNGGGSGGSGACDNKGGVVATATSGAGGHGGAGGKGGGTMTLDVFAIDNGGTIQADGANGGSATAGGSGSLNSCTVCYAQGGGGGAGGDGGKGGVVTVNYAHAIVSGIGTVRADGGLGGAGASGGTGSGNAAGYACDSFTGGSGVGGAGSGGSGGISCSGANGGTGSSGAAGFQGVVSLNGVSSGGNTDGGSACLTNSASNCALTFSTTKSDDVIFVQEVTSATSCSSPTSSPSLSYSLRKSLGFSSQFNCVYYGTWSSSGSITITCKDAGTPSYIACTAFALSGLNTTAIFDAHSGLPCTATATATSISCSLSTSYPVDVVLGFVGIITNQIVTAGGSFSMIAQTSGTSTGTAASEDLSVTSAQSGLSVSASWPSSFGASVIGDAVQIARPSVPVSCSVSNDASTPTLALSGGSVSPATVVCDGAAHQVAVNALATLSAAEPTDGTGSRYRFAGGYSSISTTACTSGVCSTWNFSNFRQYFVTNPNGLSLTGKSAGSTYTSSTSDWLDAGAVASVGKVSFGFVLEYPASVYQEGGTGLQVLSNATVSGVSYIAGSPNYLTFSTTSANLTVYDPPSIQSAIGAVTNVVVGGVHFSYVWTTSTGILSFQGTGTPFNVNFGSSGGGGGGTPPGGGTVVVTSTTTSISTTGQNGGAPPPSPIPESLFAGVVLAVLLILVALLAFSRASPRTEDKLNRGLNNVTHVTVDIDPLAALRRSRDDAVRRYNEGRKKRD